jgi:hypothetical protein
MWLHHLLNLLASAASIFFDAIGTTLLGRLVDLAFAVSVAVVVLHNKRRKEGWRAMVNHWRQEYKEGIRFTLWCVLILYSPVVIWSVGKAVYDDHEYFVGHVQSQREKGIQDANSSVEIQKGLESQISDWRAKCAGFESANTVLNNQNRDQQNTINLCQTQAIRRLQPPPDRTITYPIKELPGPNAKTFIMLTNKTVTPATIMVSCDGPITELQGSTINTGNMLYSPAYQTGKNAWTFTIASPAWTPDLPLVISYKYAGPNEPICSFQRM